VSRTMDRAEYLIIGNSAAAMGAVEGIRSLDRERPIVIVAREPHHVYSKPLISYLLAGELEAEHVAYRPSDFYKRQNIRPVLGVEVVSVEPESRRVRTGDGREFSFRKLLIATGGRPILPVDVPGLEAGGVFTFTTLDDALRIRRFIEAHGVTEVVVVGGGFIGLKAAEAIRALGLRPVVVELTDRLLGGAFDRTASDLAKAHLRRAGVEIRCNTSLTAVLRKRERVTGVVLRDGSRLACGMVILAVGVTPEVGLVKDTSIRTDRGIVVDKRMQTSVPDIYAAGDVAQAPCLLDGRRRTLPIFPCATRQGFVAGVNMAGGERAYEGGLPMNALDLCGLPVVSVGLADPLDDRCEVLSALDERAPRYRKIVLRDERIVGAIFIGHIERAGIVTGLIRQKMKVSGFKDLLLTDEFGLISLPAEYRKHMVSGFRVEV